MTPAEQSLRSGRLEEALSQTQDQIRKDPGNAKHRIFLFQILAVLGRWDKALNQLKVLPDLDAATTPMAQTYRELIRCEYERAKVFTGERAPTLFGEPEEWLACLVEAQRLLASGQLPQAEALRGRAFELAPTTAGAIDGQPFAWIADSDPRFGPTLEAIVNGRYFWIPFHRLSKVKFEAPTDLRDLVWAPATVTFSTGADAVAFIPTRYPGSEASADVQIRLARRTEWQERGPETFLGLGQRTLVTDNGTVSLLDLRTVTLGTPEATGAAPSPTAEAASAPADRNG